MLNSGFYSVIGYFIVQRALKKKVETGKIPLLNPEDLKGIDQNKILPFGIKHFYLINLTIVTGYLILMFGLPVLFYFAQKLYLTSPDTLYLDISLSSMFSFFASIGGAFIILLIVMYFDKKEIIADALATTQIVGANNVYYGVKYDWKQIITKQQVEIEKEGQQKLAKKWLIFAALICIPLYIGLFFSYIKITTSAITQSTFGKKTITPLNQIEKVTAKLSLRNSNDHDPEAEPSLVIKIFPKNNIEGYEICGPECYTNQKDVYQTIITIADSSQATFQAEPAPEYLQAFLRNEKKEYLLELNDLVLDLSRK